MEEEEEEDLSPFWLQSRHRQRRQVSSSFLSSGVLLIVLVLIGIFFLLVIIPAFISFTSQILRPQNIKRSWDSLNLVLVLFAIICGFLSRSSDSSSNGSTSYHEDRNLSDVQQNVQKPYPSTPRTWYEYPQDRPAHSSTLTRLRSFGSYPDLRQESLERWRFNDDTYLNNYRVSSFDQLYPDRPQQRQQQEEEPKKRQEDDVGTTSTAVDTYMARKEEFSHASLTSASASLTPPAEAFSSPPPPPSPPQPALPKVTRRKVKRTYQDPGNEKRSEDERHVENKNFYIPPTSPLPPPPPPPPPPVFRRKRGKDFFASLRRRKKQRQKSVENIDWLFKQEPVSTLSFLPPPPPPPLPPPPHFFQNIFSSRKGKTKKNHSDPPPTPPPPPPVTSSLSKYVSKNIIKPLEGRALKNKVQLAQAVAHKPSKAISTSSASSVEGNLDGGKPSLLSPIPPPPPLPPFRIPSWKFVFDGDYVRVGSFNSSTSGSPDLDSLEDAAPDKESSPMAALKEGGDPAMPSFCPSPDVNVKADNFIARFRAGLNSEKIDSSKGKSNLGPEASTG